MATNDPLDLLNSYDWGTASTSGPSGEDPSILSDFKGLASKYDANITSLFRTPEHNRKVGGVSNSQHLRGTAGDFVVPSDNKADFKKDAAGLGYQIIDEGNHIHLQLPRGGSSTKAPIIPLMSHPSIIYDGQSVEVNSLGVPNGPEINLPDDSGVASTASRRSNDPLDLLGNYDWSGVKPSADDGQVDWGAVASKAGDELGSLSARLLPKVGPPSAKDANAAPAPQPEDDSEFHTTYGYPLTQGVGETAAAFRNLPNTAGLDFAKSLQEVASDMKGGGISKTKALADSGYQNALLYANKLYDDTEKQITAHGITQPSKELISSIVAGKLNKQAAGITKEASFNTAVVNQEGNEVGNLIPASASDTSLQQRLAKQHGLTAAATYLTNPHLLVQEAESSLPAIATGLTGMSASSLGGGPTEYLSKLGVDTTDPEAVSKAISDPKVAKAAMDYAYVKGAATFALGKTAEMVSPDLGKLATKALPAGSKALARTVAEKGTGAVTMGTAFAAANEAANAVANLPMDLGGDFRSGLMGALMAGKDVHETFKANKAEDRVNNIRDLYNAQVAEHADVARQATDKVKEEAPLRKAAFEQTQNQADDIISGLQDNQKEAAYAANTPDDQQRADEEEAAYRQQELNRQYQSQSRVEGIPGNLERVPVNPPAGPTADDIRAEREASQEAAKKAADEAEAQRQQEAKDEADRQQRVALGGLAERVKAQDAATKEQRDKDAAELQKQKDALQQQREAGVIAQVRKENPDMKPEDLAPIVQKRISQLPAIDDNLTPTPEEAAAAKQQKVTQQVQTAKGKAESQIKAQQTKDNTKKIRSFLKANPNASDEDVVNHVMGAHPEVTTPDNKATDADIQQTVAAVSGDHDVREQARKLGLNVPDANAALDMAGNAPAEPASEGSLHTKLFGTIKALVGRGYDNPHIQNMLRNRNLILTDKPSSVGRNDQGIASYDPATGKRYIYLDRLDQDDPISHLIREATGHESSHAVSHSTRAGRSKVVHDVFAPVHNKYKKMIQDMAAKAKPSDSPNSLNVMARIAHEAATKAATEKADGNQKLHDYVYNNELTAYFAQQLEAAKAAGKPLGRAGGVLRDLTGAARTALREKLHLPLKVTSADVVHALRQSTKEASLTDKEGTFHDANGEPLDMMAGAKASGFDEAKAAGKTKTDKADNKEKFEIADNKAELNAPALSRAMAGDVPLKEVLPHPELYKQYPDAQNIKVRVDRDLKGSGVLAQQHGDTIALSPEAASNPEVARNKILHEVQHWVQDKEGFATGGSSAQFIHPIYGERARDAANAMSKFLTPFRLGEAVKTLPEPARAKFNQALSENERIAKKELPLEESKKIFMQEAAKNSNSIDVRNAARNYDRLRQDKADTATSLDKHLQQAHQKYMSMPGETEARGTEARSKMTQEELDANPRNGSNVPTGSLDMSFFKPDKEKTPAPKFGDKETLRRIIDEGPKSKTADLKWAEDLDTQYRSALSKDANGQNLLAVEKQFNDALESVDNKDPAAKKAMWDKLRKQYPNLAPVVEKARNTIDEQSLRLVQSILGSGRKLSAAEVKNVSTILANQGTYMTRAYKAFQGTPGRKWSEDRWADYTKKLQTFLDDPGRLSPKARENVQAVMEGVKFLRDNIGIPPREDLEDMSLSKLEDMYNDYVDTTDRLGAGDDAEDRRAAIIDALTKRSADITPEEYNAMADQAAKEIMGLAPNTSNYAKLFTELAKDPGTLKTRQNVPEQIRKMLGEMTDPGSRILTTLNTLAGQNARATVLRDLTKDGIGKFVLPASQINKPGMRAKFSEPLKGSQYGPLNGYYATKRTAQAIKDQADTYFTYGEAMRRFVGKGADPYILLGKLFRDVPRYTTAPITRLEKLVSVVANPVRWVMNGAGSGINLFSNGNFSPSTYKEGALGARDYVMSAMNDRTTPTLQDIHKYVNVEAVDIAEMQHMLGNKLKFYFNRTDDAASIADFIKNQSTLGAKAHRTFRTAVGGYAMLDAWTKIANFYDRYNVLKDYYAKTGSDISEEAIRQEAGNDTSYTNISNERVPKWLRLGEEKGFTKFIPYFEESLRTRYTNFDLAFRDLARAKDTENPEAAAVMRNHAIKRLVGNTMASVAMPLGASALAKATLAALGYSGTNSFALTATDPDSRRKRRLLSDFNHNQDLLQLGQDVNGKPVYFALSQQLDPFGPATDLARIAINSDDPVKDYKNYLGGLLLKPRWLTHAYGAVTQATVPQSVVEQHFPEYAQATNDFLSNLGARPSTINKALYTAEGLIPLEPLLGNEKYKAQLDPNGDPASNKVIDGMQKAGISLEAFDPSRKLKENHTAYQQDHNDAMAKLVQDIGGTTSDTTFMDTMNRYKAVQLNNFLEASKDVESLKAWGYDDGGVRDELKKAGFSSDDVTKVLNDDNKSVLKMSSILKNKTLTPEQKQNIRDMFDKHSDELNALGVDVRY